TPCNMISCFSSEDIVLSQTVPVGVAQPVPARSIDNGEPLCFASIIPRSTTEIRNSGSCCADSFPDRIMPLSWPRRFCIRHPPIPDSLAAAGKAANGCHKRLRPQCIDDHRLDFFDRIVGCKHRKATTTTPAHQC